MKKLHQPIKIHSGLSLQFEKWVVKMEYMLQQTAAVMLLILRQ